jgi:hypothetical protein
LKNEVYKLQKVEEMFEKLKTTFKKVSFKTIKPKEEFHETNQLKKESKEMNSS